MMNSPSSAEYLKQIAETILEPIKRGESAFIRWFPGHGKTAILNSIFADDQLLRASLGDFYKRFKFIKVDGYVFASLESSNLFIYIQNILSESLAENKVIISEKIPYTQNTYPLIVIIKKIINLCHKAVEKGLEMVFLIDGIDDFGNETLKEIFTAWEYIVESNRERIHTHFNVNRKDIFENLVTQSSLIQNIIHIPLPDKNESSFFISFYLKKWGFILPDDVINKIFMICGNDPTLLKESLRIYFKNKNLPTNLLEESTLYIKAKINYNLFSRHEKRTIEYKLTNGTVSPRDLQTAKYLFNANFWDKKYHIPHIYEHIIVNKSEINELYIDIKTAQLKFGDIFLHKKLSKSEYKILLVLFQKKRKVVSRDEIAERIWGEKMLDKYSDWAIDKFVSRLRTKLETLSFYYPLKTIKKKGFLLEL